jgi:lipoic acid synthetase
MPEPKQKIAKPPWLRQRLPAGGEYERVKDLVTNGKLHTVCQEAKCPNIFDCFSHKTATFLILGSRCTRNCRFCNIEPGPSEPPDPEEPARIARVAEEMGLRYVVLTSVTRDDVPDGGASLFAETIQEIRKRNPSAAVEVLIPDFQGDKNALITVLKAKPDVLNHNVETVPRLYAKVRPQAVYSRSLQLLERSNRFDPTIPTKSGLMLGLGETPEEITQTLKDIRGVGCSIITIGQYLQPTTDHLPIERYVPPEEFESWKKRALEMGFKEVASGPFVRSSYHAKDLFERIN